MIIILKKGAKEEQIAELERKIIADGLRPQTIKGDIKTTVNVLGDTAQKSTEPYESLPYVEGVFRVQDKVYKRVTKEFPEEKTIVQVNGIKIGSEKLTLMPGPCAIEGEEQIIDSVDLQVKVRDNHSGEHIEGTIMRGGAFKPRTSPDTFRGMKKEGLIIFSQYAHSKGLPIVTEVMDPRHVELVAQYADILQIGARNSQNYTLLEEVGRTRKPVLLKRAMAGSIDELLRSADYIVKEGNENLILCLRGVKGLQDGAYRNNPDIADVPYLKDKTRLPIIFDPSHSTGKRDYVIPMSILAVAAGVDGILIDIHPYPDVALVDKAQQLPPQMAVAFMHIVNHYKGAYIQGVKLLENFGLQANGNNYVKK